MQTLNVAKHMSFRVSVLTATLVRWLRQTAASFEVETLGNGLGQPCEYANPLLEPGPIWR